MEHPYPIGSIIKSLWPSTEGKKAKIVGIQRDGIYVLEPIDEHFSGSQNEEGQFLYSFSLTKLYCPPNLKEMVK